MRDASHGSFVAWLAALLCTQLAASLLAAAPQEPEKKPQSQPSQPSEPSEAPSSAGIPIEGYLSLRYRYRNSEKDGSDQDTMGLLSFQIGDPTRHWITATFLGSGNWDMDGDTSTNTFNGITDTYNSNVHGQLYDAYVDLHCLDSFQIVRLGRQTIYETPVLVTMDGARIETEELGEWRFQAGTYGGVSNHYYESSPSGDFVIGAFLGASPWDQGRFRCDWLHGADDTVTQDYDEDLVGFQFWQGIARYARLRVGYTMLGGDSRDFGADGTAYIECWDLQLQANYYQLLKTQKNLALEFDPFYDAAFDYDPYFQFRGMVTKGFGEDFSVSTGIDLRRMRDNADEGEYNRDYDHVWLTPVLEDVCVEGLSLGLTGDYWGSKDGEDVISWGADMTMECSERVRTSIGSYYALYKHDISESQERDRVRTYYVTAEYRLEPVRFRVGYEFEHAEFDDFHQLDVRMTWTF